MDVKVFKWEVILFNIIGEFPEIICFYNFLLVLIFEL